MLPLLRRGWKASEIAVDEKGDWNRPGQTARLQTRCGRCRRNAEDASHFGGIARWINRRTHYRSANGRSALRGSTLSTLTHAAFITRISCQRPDLRGPEAVGISFLPGESSTAHGGAHEAFRREDDLHRDYCGPQFGEDLCQRICMDLKAQPLPSRSLPETPPARIGRIRDSNVRSGRSQPWSCAAQLRRIMTGQRGVPSDIGY